jgi:hypothetical protein
VRSRTRAQAVIFFGLADGTLECWDLLDRSHEPALATPVAPGAVRALAFNTAAATDKAQLLAVGDDDGVLRIVEVPSTLRRPVTGEHALMARFLDTQAHKLAELEARQVRDGGVPSRTFISCIYECMLASGTCGRAGFSCHGPGGWMQGPLLMRGWGMLSLL